MELQDLNTVAVIGMGTMGRGIAQSIAAGGYGVRCHDASAAALERACPMIDSMQETLIGAGLLSAQGARAALARISTADRLDDCVGDAQIVVETAPEVLELKLELFARLDALCRPETVLASNTSGLSITRMAAATRRPAHVAGFHWWNPAHLIPLVEVTKGERTSDETAGLLMALARRLGKHPVLVRRDVPGFVGNRLQFAVFREALHLLEEGIASAEDIDAAMKAGPGLRYAFLGPLETADLGGLDVFEKISAYLFADLSDATGPSPCLTERVVSGRLGVKSGAGFYEYSDRTLQQALAERDERLLRLLRALGQSRKESS